MGVWITENHYSNTTETGHECEIGNRSTADLLTNLLFGKDYDQIEKPTFAISKRNVDQVKAIVAKLYLDAQSSALLKLQDNNLTPEEDLLSVSIEDDTKQSIVDNFDTIFTGNLAMYNTVFYNIDTTLGDDMLFVNDTVESATDVATVLCNLSAAVRNVEVDPKNNVTVFDISY